MKIVSIRTKIISIVFIFLGLISTAFIIYSIVTTADLKKLRLDGIERLVEYETEKVNKVIAGLERAAIFYVLGSNVGFELAVGNPSERLVLEFTKSFIFAVGGGYWYEPYAYNSNQLRAGFYAFHDKKENSVQMDETFFMDEYDYHNKNWYLEIKEKLEEPYQVVWTKPYVDDSGTFSLMTTAGSGIFDEEGKLVAISTIDWEIDGIIRELMEIRPTRNSFVLLSVPDQDYIISGAHININTGDSIKSLSFDIKASSFTLNGINYLTFGRYMDNGWYLTIQIPEKEIFEEVDRRNRRYSIIIAVTLILTLLNAYLFIFKFVNKPIKRLTNDVSRIALGNLDAKINVKSRDELGILASTFNKVTGDLKQSIEENAKEREEKKRISTELEVANKIQCSMLPNVFPAFPDRNEIDLFASMSAARNVGGDFYDFFFVDRDNIALVIADVSGKGIPSALYMVVAKTIIKEACTAAAVCDAAASCAKKNPFDVIGSVNEKLCENNESSMFVTAIVGILNIPTGKFSYINAGHNPPIVRRNGRFEYIKNEPCLVLGFMENAKYNQYEITLEKGDILYMYTDGVTEAMNEKKEIFGEEKLMDTLKNCRLHSPKDILLAVKNDVDNFSNGAEQADDITMLCLKMIDNKEIRIEADISKLDELFKFINTELEKYGYSSISINEINVAVEEIFVNIVKYAYDEKGGKVSVSIYGEDKTFIRFEDTGKPYNPLVQKEPNLEKDILKRNIGGLGIYLVKRIMDTVEYWRSNGKNILLISKSA